MNANTIQSDNLTMEKLWPHWVRKTTAMLEIANLQYFLLAPFARSIGSLMRL